MGWVLALTPEIGDNLECLGPEATDYLRGLLPEGSTVYTQVDVETLDQHGRSLLFVWTASGELVNLSLVADGYAEAVFIGGNRMLEAQVEAGKTPPVLRVLASGAPAKTALRAIPESNR